MPSQPPRSTRHEVGAGHSEAQENSLLKQTCPKEKLGDQGQRPQSQTCNQDLMAGCHVGAKAVCPHCFNNLVPGQFQPLELSFGQLRSLGEKAVKPLVGAAC